VKSSRKKENGSGRFRIVQADQGKVFKKMDRDDRLYVKSSCMVCRNKTYTCNYCDGVGSVYVQASDNVVSGWVRGLTRERRDCILEMILQKQEDGGTK